MVLLSNNVDDSDEIYTNLETSSITFFLIRLKTLINDSKKYSINEIENDQLVDELMRFVPEYISKNSLYSKQPNKLKKSHLA